MSRRLLAAHRHVKEHRRGRKMKAKRCTISTLFNIARCQLVRFIEVISNSASRPEKMGPGRFIRQLRIVCLYQLVVCSKMIIVFFCCCWSWKNEEQTGQPGLAAYILSSILFLIKRGTSYNLFRILYNELGPGKVLSMSGHTKQALYYIRAWLSPSDTAILLCRTAFISMSWRVWPLKERVLETCVCGVTVCLPKARSFLQCRTTTIHCLGSLIVHSNVI